ncbi:MAG: hypothetical protein HFJ10_00205 [Lachnospiraceae bacterium]|jgi:uroporphyrinogen decarboxylase|nr:hypothetical protein [Lachnospiraceae bacterium]
MTGYERVSEVLKGNIPDRIPVMMHNFLMAAREAGLTMEEFRSSANHMSMAMIKACQTYELDGIFLDVDTALLASACGARVKYPTDIAAVCEDMQTRSIPQIIEDLKKVDLKNNERVQIYLEAVEILSAWCKKEGVYMRANADQGPFSLACLLTGMNEFLMNLLDEDMEEELKDLIQCTYRISSQMHHLCIEAGADGTSYGNSSEGCSVISPELFRKFGKPMEIRLAQELKKNGITSICHICGRITPILEDLAETGLAAIEMDAKTDLIAAKKAAKGHFIISGNLDPALLASGSQEEIRTATKHICDMFREEGGLILCSGCALSPYTPGESIRTVVDTVKTYG